MFASLGGYVRHLAGDVLGNLKIDDLAPARAAGAGIYMALTWNSFRGDFSSWLSSGPAFLACILWGLDMASGLAAAIAKREPFSPTRGLWGVVKLLIWMAALFLAWLMRVNGYPADDFMAPILEFTVILTESSSVLRNLGELLERATGKPNKLLRYIADRADRTQEVLIRRLETIETEQALQAEQVAQLTEQKTDGGAP